MTSKRLAGTYTFAQILPKEIFVYCLEKSEDAYFSPHVWR
jgi:hypothetical protein